MVYLNLKSDFGVHRVRLFLKWLAFVTETGRVASANLHVLTGTSDVVRVHVKHKIIFLEQV